VDVGAVADTYDGSVPDTNHRSTPGADDGSVPDHRFRIVAPACLADRNVYYRAVARGDGRVASFRDQNIFKIFGRFHCCFFLVTSCKPQAPSHWVVRADASCYRLLSTFFLFVALCAFFVVLCG